MQADFLPAKLAALITCLKGYGKVAIAYSGGVDSAFLALAAKQALGDNVVALTVVSPTMALAELADARRVAVEIGLPHVELVIDETLLPEFAQNDDQRCYHCKKYRLEIIGSWAADNGFELVLDGSNVDDGADYRPGMRALAEYAQVKSPLREVGLNKQEVRQAAKEQGLSVWDKPSAACLASRVCYGLKISRAVLKQIEQAEQVIAAYCPNGNVRVRLHEGDLARIEVDSEYLPLLATTGTAAKITEELRKLGFSYVTLDCAGFASGSMNRLIGK